MSSGKDAWSLATAGTPADLASITTKPKVSSHTDGATTATASSRSWLHAARDCWPRNSTLGSAAAQTRTSASRGPAPAITSGWRKPPVGACSDHAARSTRMPFSTVSRPR